MICIRTAELADAAALAEVHVLTWRDSYRGLLDGVYLERLNADRLTARWRANLLQRDRDRDEEVFVAEASGRVIGFSMIGATREASSLWDGEVWMIYVLKEHRGAGVGRALMKASADHLIRRGLFSCGLWVLRDNGAARDFYELLDGEPGGRKLDSVGGQIVPLVAYMWSDAAVLAERRAPEIRLPFA